MEDYYTKIPNDLLEVLYQVSLSNYEFRVFLFILRKTYGFNKKQDWISQKQIAEITGIHKCHISRTIKKLSEKNMIINNKVNNKKIIGIQENYKKWKLPKEVTNLKEKLPKQVIEVTQTGNYKLPKEAHTKETLTKETIQNNIYSRDDLINNFNKEDKEKENKEQIGEIISYLNGKTGKNFRANNKNTIKEIKARLNDDYTIADFKKVIDIKKSQWKNTEYDKYLRPKTLFGNKFEDYLNERIVEVIKTKEEEWKEIKEKREEDYEEEDYKYKPIPEEAKEIIARIFPGLQKKIK